MRLFTPQHLTPQKRKEAQRRMNYFFKIPPLRLLPSLWCRILPLTALLAALNASAQVSYEKTVRPFLDTYCISCHGPEKQKGDRRYDTLSADLSSEAALDLWQDIVDQLNRGEMPPPKAKQPSAAHTSQVVQWATAQRLAANAARQSTGGQTVLRRLNRYEYDRSVRQLLALEPLLGDPTDSFPPDETTGNFDNIGATLITTDFLLEKQLSAAAAFLDHAIVTGPKPELRKYNFHAPFCPTGNRHDGQDISGQYQNIRKNTSDVGGFLWLAQLPAGVPHDGYYTLRFKAQAMNRDYPYAERGVGVRKDEALRVAIVAGSAAYGDLELKTSSDRQLAEFELPDDQPKWFEARVWLDAGYQPRFTFPNGPSGVKQLRFPLLQKYPELFPKFIKGYLTTANPGDPEFDLAKARQKRSPKKAGGDGTLTTEGTKRDINSQAGWSQFFAEYQGPRVRVFEIELEGPINERWPTPSHKALFGDLAPTMENAEAILRRFASRAFRRPVADDELQVLTELVQHRNTAGDAPLAALKAGFQAVLCSPNFLYLQENPGTLDDYALASRLSYFLWSSIPDEELLALAAKGKLHKPETLAAQTSRLLADPKARAFTENFTARWLALHKLGSMPPSPATHRDYYVDNLEPAMRRETQLFFQHLLSENLPIARFLDADFTFVNGGLARLYGIAGVKGMDFQQVVIKDPRRGGLLGQASVLTASANGIDTSPVIRGIWVSENLLGTRPPPPPPDVKALEPDIRGATTIRDQLKKHRDIATCNECHRKIDPLGFALENFDPIGAWRDHYGRDRDTGTLPVDPSGQMPDGQEFADIVGFKKILTAREDQFARCLTEKLLAYATGRMPETADRPHIDRIVADAKAKGNGLQDLVVLVVQSRPFRIK